MSEFRQSAATGDWVIISPERSRRPKDYTQTKIQSPEDLHPAHSENCPFCKGNEHQCEDPVYEVKDGEDWLLRVVPNIYAAVSTKHSPLRCREDMHLKAGGYGVADVLIETPVHNQSLAHMSVEHITRIIQAYRIRYNEISKDPNIQIINIFRNYGKAAGASLVHPHSQIIGTLVAPPGVSDQIHYARRAHNTYGRCIYCDIIDAEVKNGCRIVDENELFISMCPFASRSPYELRIFPKQHRSVFGNILPEEEVGLADILKTSLLRLYHTLGDPDYNYFIRSISTKDGDGDHYHWYVVIVPKINNHAGFEMGTSMYINPSRPEDCAEDLRAVEI